MIRKYAFILFVIIMSFIVGKKSPHRTIKHKYVPKNSTTCITKKPPEVTEINNHLMSTKCRYRISTTGRVIINPYKNIKENLTKPKEFGSVYLKCAMCLAVAEQMDKVFKSVRSINTCLQPDEIRQIIDGRLDRLCKEGFKSYDLRKLDSYILLTDNIKSTTHVCTSRDYQWPIKLQETCLYYIEHIDTLQIYHKYNDESFKLSEALCSGDGIFRECTNLQYCAIAREDPCGCTLSGVCTCEEK